MSVNKHMSFSAVGRAMLLWLGLASVVRAQLTGATTPRSRSGDVFLSSERFFGKDDPRMLVMRGDWLLLNNSLDAATVAAAFSGTASAFTGSTCAASPSPSMRLTRRSVDISTPGCRTKARSTRERKERSFSSATSWRGGRGPLPMVSR